MTPDERDLVSGATLRGKPSINEAQCTSRKTFWILPSVHQEAGMLAVCINCWHELESESERCPRCGAIVDSESHSYERLLFWALKNSQPEHRAEVCRVLGLRGHKEAVVHLIEAVNDHATVVRVAALGALGAIADESARPVIEKALGTESLEVQNAARRALKQIEASRKQPSSIPSTEPRTPEAAHHVR